MQKTPSQKSDQIFDMCYKIFVRKFHICKLKQNKRLNNLKILQHIIYHLGIDFSRTTKWSKWVLSSCVVFVAVTKRPDRSIRSIRSMFVLVIRFRYEFKIFLCCWGVCFCWHIVFCFQFLRLCTERSFFFWKTRLAIP